jgi:DNA polymerase (family 10)
MPVHNADIAAIFDEIADLLEIENANPFRVRAYRNASRNLQGLQRDVADAGQDGTLTLRIPGVGTDLSARIVEISTTCTRPSSCIAQ